MDHPAVNAFVIGIVAGLPVSFHCVLMCGPLTGAFVGRGAVVFWYHAARILAYTGIGLFLGMLGAFAGVSGAGSSDWSPILSFIVAGMLVLFAFRVEISLHLIPGVKDHLQKRMAQAATFSPAKRAVVVGLLTPLLPCGPLWLIFAASAVTGSALNGAAMMFGFGLAVFPAARPRPGPDQADSGAPRREGHGLASEGAPDRCRRDPGDARRQHDHRWSAGVLSVGAGAVEFSTTSGPTSLPPARTVSPPPST